MYPNVLIGTNIGGDSFFPSLYSSLVTLHLNLQYTSPTEIENQFPVSVDLPFEILSRTFT